MPLLHRPHDEFTAKRGFTLVEIALVLSIIGLLIGAVVGGAAMLRQSELQTVMTDYGKYTAAVSNFRLQYGGLPGDMIDATSFGIVVVQGVLQQRLAVNQV